MLKDFDLIVSVVSKENVIAGNLKPIDKMIEYLKGQDCCKRVVLILDGFCDGSDQLFEIPEVRQWVSLLFQKHPYFLYFMADYDDMSLIYLACVGNVKTVTTIPISPNEMAKNGIVPEELPKVGLSISLPEEVEKALVYHTTSYLKKKNELHRLNEVLKPIFIARKTGSACH